MEIWVDITEYEGLYQISNRGRVRSHYSKNGRLTTKYTILALGTDRDGYPKLTLCKNKKYKYVKVHRLVAETFIHNPNKLPQINHIDGDKLNNTVENLEWCDAEYNIKHAHDTGLHKGCRTKVKITRNTQMLIFNSITEASDYLKVDRHDFNKQRKIHGNNFEFKGYSVTLIGGKQGGGHDK